MRWLLANNAELHITNKMKETPLATLRGQECYIAELLELSDTEVPFRGLAFLSFYSSHSTLHAPYEAF